MKTYCVRKKTYTDCVPGSEKIVKTKTGRNMLKCKCVSCGIAKTKFIKKSDLN